MPMTETASNNETEFVLRRLSGSFSQYIDQVWAAVPLVVVLVSVGVLVAARIARRAVRARNPKAGGWYPLLFWLVVVGNVAYFCRRLFLEELTAPDATTGLGTEFAFANSAMWYGFVGVLLALGLTFVVWKYVRERRATGWWAVPLALCRMTVYVLLAGAFLLPATQTWVRTEKNSKVVVVFDVTPSMTDKPDEMASPNGPKPKTRMAKVIDAITDEKIAFLTKLLEKNPVTAYRFGTRLDEDAHTFEKGSPGWTRAEWDAWFRFDYKQWVLEKLSPAAQDAVKKMPAWGEGPGNAKWGYDFANAAEAEAVPADLNPDDKQKLEEMRFRDKNNPGTLVTRVETAQSYLQGTNVPGSLVGVVNRESANMVQGIVVFSDGRSNLGSAAAIPELRDRAARENIPVFTVAVGEAREPVSIAMTPIQAPDGVAPGEPFKVVVEADGVGLTKKEVDVTLGLFLPTKDPKRDSPSHELTVKMTFEPGDPPHGVAEFTIDPDKLPEDLTEPSKKAGSRRQMKLGQWSMVARIARDRREEFDKPEHVTAPKVLSVLDKKTRILLWASGPTREYQTLRTLLVREVSASRAELSIFLQNEGGEAGTIVQDVPPERLLNKFPTRLDTTNKATDAGDDKFYNLNEYDLIIAFDPDWTELTDDQIKNLQSWVDNLGGGLIYVADPLNTYQLARQDETGRFKPLLDILPVIPDDIILIATRGIPRTPRRLSLKPLQDFDVLRLEESAPDDPVAGWEKFFTGHEKLTPEMMADKTKYLNPDNGFYKYYPVKLVKPGASVLMEYLEPGEAGEVSPKPFLITTQPARGRTAFVGAGEFYRLRGTDPAYYDRFWIKFIRYVAGNRDAKASRGRVLVSKEFTSGSAIRVQARILAPNGSPYPENELNAKFKITQYSTDGQTMLKPIGVYPMAPKKAVQFDGYYAGQVRADPRLFPPGSFLYKVSVDVPDSPGEPLEGSFRINKSNPELDNTRPDFAAMEAMASTLAEMPAIARGSENYTLFLGNAGDDKKAKLAFKLADTEKLGKVPGTMEPKISKYRNKGPVEDLWDKPLEATTLPETFLTRWLHGGPVPVSWLLLAVVALLSTEWLIRKLLRMA
ncbi:MAG TPA: hypothetical protein VGJ05_08050 [Fimbriiglobus sp.]|jgi:hypothetical protein